MNFRMVVISALIIAFTSVCAQGTMDEGQYKSGRLPVPPKPIDLKVIQ